MPCSTVAGYPVKLFKRALRSGWARLDPHHNKSILEFYPNVEIPAKTYGGNRPQSTRRP